MIISHGRKYVFVHSPKTGGTALSLALEERAMADDILIGDTPKAVKRRNRVKKLTSHGRLWKHSTLRDIDGLVSPEELETMFVVTLVRNPWDRMVSYYHWLQDQSFDHPAVALSKSISFADFVCAPMIEASMRDNPYASYVTTIKGIVRCDLFIRLEHLSKDVALFENHLGFSLHIPVANRSNRDVTYGNYYTDKAYEAVKNYCSQDIERFGYSFDL